MNNEQKQELVEHLEKALDSIDQAYEDAHEKSHRAQADAYEMGCSYAHTQVCRAMQILKQEENG